MLKPKNRGMNLEFFSVDRIEKNVVICENQNGEEVIISSKNIPPELEEGNIIFIDGNGNIVIDEQKTRYRKNLIVKLRKESRNINH